MRLHGSIGRHVLAGLVVAGLFAVGGATDSRATHTVCDDSDGSTTDDINNTTTLPVVGTLFVGVDHTGSSSPPSPVSGWRGVCVGRTDPGGNQVYRSVFVAVGDHDPAGPGATVKVLSCTVPSCSTTLVDDTGAEAGSTTACDSTTGGTCVQDTTAYVDGDTPVHLPERTGADDNVTFPAVTQGTTDAHNIACVGNACVRSARVSAGRVDVYVNRPDGAPTASVPVCVAVGPNMPCP